MLDFGKFQRNSLDVTKVHCLKSVRIQSFSGPYLVQMRENAGKKNSECGYFSRSGACVIEKLPLKSAFCMFKFSVILE